jgi:hypothetical protein
MSELCVESRPRPGSTQCVAARPLILGMAPKDAVWVSRTLPELIKPTLYYLDAESYQQRESAADLLRLLGQHIATCFQFSQGQKSTPLTRSYTTPNITFKVPCGKVEDVALVLNYDTYRTCGSGPKQLFRPEFSGSSDGQRTSEVEIGIQSTRNYAPLFCAVAECTCDNNCSTLPVP